MIKKFDDDALCSVLEKYTKEIVNMRQQYESKKFGLVFGAGVSVDLGFPGWSELVQRISDHPKIKSLSFKRGDRDDASSSQILYQYYKASEIENATGEDKRYNRLEMKIRSGWQTIVRDALYQGVPDHIAVLQERDHYLFSYIDIIKNTALTVNYNFDDTIQKMLALSRNEHEREQNRGYTTEWRSHIDMYPRTSVIYHPNGFLPRRLQENASDQLVFSEDSFADQLIDSISGHYAYLVNHFAQNTGLFIGLSLSDTTLKHLLRQHALRYPGHYHYYIFFLEDGKEASHRKEIVESNFDVYNLITLFLNREEMACLGELLAIGDVQFRSLVDRIGSKNIYKYFLTGSVCVGKTTALSQFRSLATQVEWSEPILDNMEKDPSKLSTVEEIEKIDKWVAMQVGIKNRNMMEYKSGIHLVDRAPLDAFAFTPEDKWVEKAKLLKEGISPGKSNYELCPAHVIFMVGEPCVMACRALGCFRDTDAVKLEKQQELLFKVYGGRDTGVTIVDTRDKSIQQVAKEIARIIHLDQYTEAPLQEWLNVFEEGTANVD